MDARIRRPRLAFALLAAHWPVAVLAGMTGLSDEDMAGVAGQDGLSQVYDMAGISATSMGVTTDSGANAGGMLASGLTLRPFGGASTVTSTWSMDVGATGTNAMPQIDLGINTSRFRLGGNYSGGVGDAGFLARLAGDTSRNFGAWTFISDVEFRLTGMPLYGTPSTTALRLALNDARLLYQQNWYYHANLAFDDIDFLWQMPSGTIDISSNGLSIIGNTTFNIDFDLYYKFHPDQDMSTLTANDRPLLGFAWGGLLNGAEVYLRAGGLWNTAANAGTTATFASLPTGRTEGINTGLRWNYGNNFNWRIGHAGGDREYLEFGDWRNLEHNAGAVPGRYGFDFPLIVIDTLNAGSATNAGGGLCWGGTQTTGSACTSSGTLLSLLAGTVEGYPAAVNRTGGATAVHLVRNGNLLAWSNSVKVGSVTKPALDATYTWGLIYTLANIQSNVYLYPGGSESDPGGGSRNQGVLGDVLFMTQSTQQGTENWTNASVAVPTRWSHGSHFLIADTTQQQGIGLLGSSFLLAADDLRLWLKNTWGGQAYPANTEGGIDLFSPRVRAQLKGLFGGARLPNGLDLVRGANIDLNFEGLWNMRLSPAPTGTNDLLAYSVAIRFRCGSAAYFGCNNNVFANSTGSTFASGNGSYISLAEPGRADVDLRFANMSGDIVWNDGTLRLRAADETGTGKSDLTLANTLLIGASGAGRMNDAATGVGLGPGGAAGRTFTTTTYFGGNEAWSLAIPAASSYTAITLRPH